MIGRTNTGGGGGGLNFQIVGGTTLPSNPKENTIWINTDTKITSWAFSATEPEAPSEGMVWILTGLESSTQFNALKKNTLIIYPASAKQYISGAWVNMTARSYIGGKWVNWTVYLYNNGNTCDDVTGGWVGYAKKTSSGLGTGVEPKITEGTETLAVSVSGSSYPAAMVCTKEKIDLTGKKTLYFDGFRSTATVYISLWSDIGTFITDNQVSATTITNNSRDVTAVDISSLSGSYYVGFQFKGNNTKPNVTMYAMWAE